jgi:hypothetical protein
VHDASRDPEVTSSFQNVPRPNTVALQGRSCRAATGVRIMPWRQPGDWEINSSGRLHRASPSSPLRARLVGQCSKALWPGPVAEARAWVGIFLELGSAVEDVRSARAAGPASLAGGRRPEMRGSRTKGLGHAGTRTARGSEPAGWDAGCSGPRRLVGVDQRGQGPASQAGVLMAREPPAIRGTDGP